MIFSDIKEIAYFKCSIAYINTFIQKKKVVKKQGEFRTKTNLPELDFRLKNKKQN